MRMYVLVEKMIRQMMMVGFSGLSLSHEVRKLIKEISVGGVILFARNYETPTQIKQLCTDLQSICADTSAPPMFIAIDQEGGRVTRLHEPFTHFPPMRKLGEKDSTELALRFARAAARELKAVGINVNFAPVLDVDSNPKNPIIGDRALGNEPGIVSQMSVPIINGFHFEGVLAVGKHFPGHGDTQEDSHLTLPVVNKTMEELKKCELLPFRHVIQNGLQAMMTAHVLYPELDENNPATLSTRIITGMLRNDMGFNGIIFSDDFEMKALNQASLGEAAVNAVKAGVDILITCHSPEKQQTIYDALLAAVRSGEIKPERIEESYKRILRVKKSVVSDDKKPDNSWIGHKNHAKLVEEITYNPKA